MGGHRQSTSQVRENELCALSIIRSFLIVLMFGFLQCRLDRRRQRKIKEWDKHHSKYVTMFKLSVEQAQSSAAAKLREFCPLAFNNYLKWFLESTRVEICKAAYHDDILEDPAAFDELSKNEYNKLVREGH